MIRLKQRGVNASGEKCDRSERSENIMERDIRAVPKKIFS